MIGLSLTLSITLGLAPNLLLISIFPISLFGLTGSFVLSVLAPNTLFVSILPISFLGIAGS